MLRRRPGFAAFPLNYRRARGLLAALLLAAPSLAAAAITDLRGRVESRVTEFRDGKPAGSEFAADDFPTTSDLPLRVLALVSAPAEKPGGGSAAAGLFDPSTSTTENPAEFALQLSLSSASDAVRFEGSALAREERDVVFSPDEVNRAAGERVQLIGRLFLDGALTAFAPQSSADLTGVSVAWHASVVQRLADGAEFKLFDGTLTLSGGAGGTATVEVSGDFPPGIVFVDGSGAPDLFPAFNIAVVPATAIDFEYEAIVGEEFQLIATMELTGANAAGFTGVTALVGAPQTDLPTVINETFGAPRGDQTLARIAAERADPTGEPLAASDPLRLCGLFGLESALGAALLGFTAIHRRRRPETLDRPGRV